MKAKSNFLILLVGATMTLWSCKPEVKGCTNQSASNYDADAEKDDGTCRYSGSYIIWFGATEGYELIGNGVEELNYFVDGQYLETTGSYSYLYEIPSCSDELPVYFSRDLSGANQTINFTYQITDQNDDEIYSGTGTFEADKCKKIELQ